MNLPQIGVVRIGMHAREMLHFLACMDIAFDPKTGDDIDVIEGFFRKTMFAVAMNRFNKSLARHHLHGFSRYHFVITYLRPLRTFMP